MAEKAEEFLEKGAEIYVMGSSGGVATAAAPQRILSPQAGRGLG